MFQIITARNWLILFLLLSPVLSGCSGGGGGNNDPSPAITYTIGGTVTGLASGQSVVLQNNGGDNLTLSANGGFTFTTAINDGGSYGVTVLTQPADQTCSVINGSGTVSGADVTSVSVKCRAWTGSGAIDTEDLGDAGLPKVAVDAAGNVTAVWGQYDNTGNKNLWARRYVIASGGWDTAGKIETLAGLHSEFTQPVVDDAGNVTVVWSQPVDPAGAPYVDSIWSNRFSSGAWETTASERDAEPGNAWGAASVVDSNGDVTVAWRQFDGTYESIYATRFTGGAWEVAQPLETDTGNASRPGVAVDGSGNVVAVWPQELTAGVVSLRARRFDVASGTWGAVATIDTVTATGGPEEFSVIADSTGTFTVAWLRYRDAGQTLIDLRAVRFGNDLTAASADYLETLSDSVVGSKPALTVDDAGNVTVLWVQPYGARDAIWASRFSGDAWSTPLVIDLKPGTEGWGNSDLPFENAMAVESNGDVVAVWMQANGAGRNALVTARYSGGAWNSAMVLDGGEGTAATPSLQDYPAVVVDTYGVVSVVWHESTDSGYALKSRHYTDGAWANIHTIATDATNPLSRPVLAVDGNGTVWAFFTGVSGAYRNLAVVKWDAPPMAPSCGACV